MVLVTAAESMTDDELRDELLKILRVPRCDRTPEQHERHLALHAEIERRWPRVTDADLDRLREMQERL